jgi:probable HAF family extracellular repeat protein
MQGFRCLDEARCALENACKLGVSSIAQLAGAPENPANKSLARLPGSVHRPRLAQPIAFSTRCAALVASSMLLPFTVLGQTSALVDLGVRYGTAINNSGQVALASWNSAFASVTSPGWIYDHGTLTPMPALPGAATTAVPLAINASGQIAGMAANALDDCFEPILYSGGTLTTIVLPFGDPNVACAAGTGINAAGTVVGYTDTISGSGLDAFMYSAGTATGIGGFPGTLGFPASISAAGINTQGAVTGNATVLETVNPVQHAFLYANDSIKDLGRGAGNAINDNGQVAGAATTTTGSHAFLYSDGQNVDLGALPGGTHAQGLAINATGEIVGSSDLTGAAGTHAFFYNGVLTDLNAVIAASDGLKPFVTLIDATGINDGRLIITNGIDSRDGQRHAYLLQGPWTDIEPASLTFAGEAVGSVSPSQSVTLKNSGTAALTLAAPVVSANFSETSNCGSSLAGAASCSIQVSLAPAASGDPTGTLKITADAVPYVVSLSGVAPVAVVLSASPATVTVGSSTLLTWTLSAGSTCAATGGNIGDGWSGSVTGSGSRAVTEAVAGAYTYGLSCTAGSQSGQASAAVQVNLAASGGGGAIERVSLLALLGLVVLSAAHRRVQSRLFAAIT